MHNMPQIILSSKISKNHIEKVHSNEKEQLKLYKGDLKVEKEDEAGNTKDHAASCNPPNVPNEQKSTMARKLARDVKLKIYIG